MGKFYVNSDDFMFYVSLIDFIYKKENINKKLYV